MQRPTLADALKPAGYPYHDDCQQSPWWHLIAAIAILIAYVVLAAATLVLQLVQLSIYYVFLFATVGWFMSWTWT